MCIREGSMGLNYRIGRIITCLAAQVACGYQLLRQYMRQVHIVFRFSTPYQGSPYCLQAVYVPDGFFLCHMGIFRW